MEHDDLRHLIALTFIDDFGPVTVNDLLRRFGSPRSVFLASPSELAQSTRLSKSSAVRIGKFDDWHRVDREIENAERMGVSFITVDDERYPPLLRHIYDYPPLLYMKGFLLKDDVNVAVVGSRRSTAQGRFNCDRLCRDLAIRGITIVSGMARGIDSAAHRGALSARGRTVAVLGTGIDVVYPYENKKLYEKIISSGAVISEYPFGTTPLPHNFPRRNRIISGMSYGVVVIEATEKSGSLITARTALEQGRDVFAVPGGIEMPTSRGTNGLIKSGARLIQDADDIISEILPQLERGFADPTNIDGSPERDETSGEVPEKTRQVMPMDGIPMDHRAVLDLLSDRPRHLDSLAGEVDTPINRLLDILLVLEMKGCVRQLPGKYFVVKE